MTTEKTILGTLALIYLFFVFFSSAALAGEEPFNCRHQKTSILLPEGAPLPDLVEYKSKTAEGRALEQIYAYAKETHSEALKLERERKNWPYALAHYEASIKTIRDSKYPLDAKFKKRIAKDFARLLRKSGDSKKAKLILKEFLDGKSESFSGYDARS